MLGEGRGHGWAGGSDGMHVRGKPMLQRLTRGKSYRVAGMATGSE